ncbi:AAA family ATPase [Paenibacillus hexagrammi]|uniref:Uncharacterized protein n=1 Tax=Paenibacillus hexagrammi TaxID=2908839 RepID=A0ABY3SPT5_9BACL|nr:hypothetical protein [Paenibacillus sp. YPD9-1]UJF35852.1 hypothetical protein L0M14_12680 [Paenibacillus sp. YPD9-1]
MNLSQWAMQLAEAKEKGRLQRIWKERLASLEQDLERQKRLVGVWEEQLRKEQKDVDKLKQGSFKSMLYDLVNKKEAKLAAEEQEALEAKLKYDEALRELIEIESRIEQVKERLHAVRFWDLEVEDISGKIEACILQTDPVKARQLQDLAKQRAELERRGKELNEAIKAASTVVHYVSQAQEKLRSAKNWGTYDMLGGGFMSTYIKNGKIDEAMDEIKYAQQSLSHLEKELNDVQLTMSIELNISSFLRFADYFFDGMISDWMVQGKIHETLSQVELKLEEVEEILDTLRSLSRSTEQLHTEAVMKYESMIANPI